MYSPIFKIEKENIEFIFPKLYTPTEEMAIEAGKCTAGIKKTHDGISFTNKAVNIKNLQNDNEVVRIIAPFKQQDGSEDYILILEPLEITEELKNKE